jgi:hypothetical protein
LAPYPPAPTFMDALLLPHLPKVYGEVMAEMPRDLYIPPDALEIILESFEGPLDLLLYLIRRANINVLDIPMAPLDSAVSGLCRSDAQTQPRTGRRVPADGGDADRDQVAHAVAPHSAQG